MARVRAPYSDKCEYVQSMLAVQIASGTWEVTSALSKVMCREGDKTVLAFGNIFSTLSFMQLVKASMTCLGRNCLGQLILHGTQKARLINTSSYDINWNLDTFRVSVREHLPNPLFL